LKKEEIIKYSQIRNKCNFYPERDSCNLLAGFTHYLHNKDNGLSNFYKPAAVEYINNLPEKCDEVAEFQMQLPIHWDIPFPPPEKPKFTFVDLFAGIGGTRLAYQNLGGKSVFTSEWDKFAKRTYERNFGEVPFGDITKINEKDIPDHDILLAGFPCQPFSIAGVSKKNSLRRKHGFLDETQGTLFFDIARIIKEKRPDAFMLENVKNLQSHDKGKTFQVIRETLEAEEGLNYSIYYSVIDGKHFVSQHRERIFIVGFNREKYKGQESIDFKSITENPDKIKYHLYKKQSDKYTLSEKISEILENNPDDKYTLSDKLWNYLKDYSKKHKSKGNGFGYGLVDLNGISRTLSARYFKDGSEILIPQKNKNPRKLTPRECARLMGFPDNFEIPVSNNQAYKQFGNSIIVPLAEAVGQQIIKNLKSKDD
jgi:DNA (cytosine-5)-methyltransferase 1